MMTSVPFRCLVASLYLMTLVGALGQTSPSSQGDSQAQAYQQAQASLEQSWQALVNQGATVEQLEAWRQQNAAQITALQQQAAVIGAASAMRPATMCNPPVIPANASQTLTDFLNMQTALANARAQIHNQLLQSMPANPTVAQVNQMLLNEAQLFEEQHAADMQAQVQRAQTLAAAAAQTPTPVPGPTMIPPNASPQLAAYLTARDELSREEIQLRNQYLNADPATREAAIEQWHQQNAAQFQQLQQLAQNLSQANSTTQN